MILQPEIELKPWSEQTDHDRPLFTEQVRYLFERSAFYRDKLGAAGFETADAVGPLDEISKLPFTEKDELRASRSDAYPIGTHIAAASEDIARIYSTSGTTGIPSFIPLTAGDVGNWELTSARSFAAPGGKRGDRVISTYNAGPFVAGAALGAFDKLGFCHIPIGTGNTARLMTAIDKLKPQMLACTPSYALHLAEWGRANGIDMRATSIERICTAGEPGGGEPAMRAMLQEEWNAQVTEAMGIGDIGTSLWGECNHQQGMHFSARGFVHFELIDPGSGENVRLEDSATGELVLTHLRHRGAPLLRFRTRDHVMMWTGRCACGRTAPRVRCIGRTDDMFIVRGVNVFPTAVREIVNEFIPSVSGVISIRPATKSVNQDPPVRMLVEKAEGLADAGDLAERMEARIREVLIARFKVELVEHGSLPRSEYKSKLIDYADAT